MKIQCVPKVSVQTFVGSGSISIYFRKSVTTYLTHSRNASNAAKSMFMGTADWVLLSHDSSNYFHDEMQKIRHNFLFFHQFGSFLQILLRKFHAYQIHVRKNFFSKYRREARYRIRRLKVFGPGRRNENILRNFNRIFE